MYTFDPRQRLLILSDLHLGDGTRSDPFRRKDRRLLRFLKKLSREIDGIVLNGDIFDDHQARPRARMKRAHRKVVSALESLARKIPVVYLPGNHDERSWEEGLIRGAIYAREAAIGEEAYIHHGDAYDPLRSDLDWGAHLHAAIERVTGCAIQVPLQKHDNAVNRVFHWLAYHFTGLYRWAVESLRPWGLADGDGTLYEEYLGRAVHGDVNCLFEGVRKDLEEKPYSMIICGHSHIPGVVLLPEGCYANTGSWVHADSGYGLYRSGSLEVLDWSSRRAIGAGIYDHLRRMKVPSLKEWWKKHYRGWLQFGFEPK